MPTEKSIITFIKKKIRATYAELNLKSKDLLADSLVDAIASLHNEDLKTAYAAAQRIYTAAGKLEEVASLFHSDFFAEDVITNDSVVFIHQDSPYYKSLMNLSQTLNFSVQAHKFIQTKWTKDYIVSTGKDVVIPIKDPSRIDTYLTPVVVERAKENSRLYYKSLGLSEHHQAKVNFTSAKDWEEKSSKFIAPSVTINKTALEGGNLFCAINKFGTRYILIGENVVSETMAMNDINRDDAIKTISAELDCPMEQLLFIPQWAYHLDMQMAYLGNGQFAIHSFDLKDIDLGLSGTNIDLAKKTFAHLESLFEKEIIDTICDLLKKHGFQADKILGCLFYLEDCSDINQLKWVPYGKGGVDFEGAMASMINGITLNQGGNERHFITSRCDLSEFRTHYVASLKKLGIKEIHDADMLDYYDYSGNYEPMASGMLGTTCISDVATVMNGGLRCQTSIVSKALTPIYNPEGAAHRFFQKVEALEHRTMPFAIRPIRFKL